MPAAARLPIALAALAGAAAAPPPATPVPTADPEAAAEAFVAICWRGLRRPAGLRRAIRRARLGFRREADERGEQRYRAAGIGIAYEPNRRCTFNLALQRRAEGQRVVELISHMLGLPVPPGAINHTGTAAAYWWRARPVAGGRIGLTGDLDFERRPPPRLEIERVHLSVSVYFDPAN